MMCLLSKAKPYFFSLLSKTSIVSANQTALILDKNQPSWSYNKLVFNSKGLTNAFHQFKLSQEDTILIGLYEGNFKQKVLLKIAAANKKAKIVQSKATTRKQFEEELDSTRARAFVFNSYDKIGTHTAIELIYKTMPEIMGAPNDSEIVSERFQNLRQLIQVDHYKYSGTFNFNKFMKFDTMEYTYPTFECQQKPINLFANDQESNGYPIVITQTFSDLAFRGGILNCLVNGATLICSDPHKVKNISQKFEHKINIICTQPIPDIHEENQVFVEAGSKLCQNHSLRRQISI